MAITILLRKVKKFFKSQEHLLELITKAKSKEITLDYLTCLKKILPDKVDVDEIQTYIKESGDFRKLSEADQFIKLLSDIPCYELRINLMTFVEEFDELYTKLETPLKVYTKASKIILKNEALKLFFGLILSSGNFLNSNSYRGNACGFKINILPQLLEVKTNKPAITLLHVIIEQFETIKDSMTNKFNENNYEFVQELKEFGAVSK